MSAATALRGRTAPRTVPRRSPLLVVGAMLLALAIADQIVFGGVLTPGLASSLLSDTCFLLPLAVGETVVVLTGGLDLSVGSIVGLGGMVAAHLLGAGVPAVVVMPVVVLVGTAIGAVNAVLVAGFDVPPFVATLAAMFLARGLAYGVDLHSVAIGDPTLNALTQDAIGVGGFRIPLGVILALAAAATVAALLHRTRFGRTVYAAGGNRAAARLMGLPVTRSIALAYLLSGTCAGLGAVVFASYTSSGDPQAGLGMELQAVAAVVIGGTLLAGGSGGIAGSLLGVLVTGLIQITVNDLGVDSWWTSIAVGGLLLLFVLAQRFARPAGRRPRESP